jgi:Zn-dependent peptidase ImmA (M78 family)
MKDTLLALAKYGWGKRSLGEEDFYDICEAEGIEIIHAEIETPGMYMIYREKAYICVDRRLKNLRWLRTAFHELSHHFLHAPCVAFYGIGNPKQEDEAETLALIALLCLDDLLEEMYVNEVAPDREGNRLLRDRIGVLNRFQL